MTEHTREGGLTAMQKAPARDMSGQSRGGETERLEQTVVRRVAKAVRVSLQDVVCEAVDAIAERMIDQPDEIWEDLKTQLRNLMGGAGGARHREEFAFLQKMLLSRPDLTPELLLRANRAQLELLVAIKTGVPAFLHPDISMTQCILMEIFFNTRCRNVACQNHLPGDDCTCEICNSKNGFCNACMCTICSKFDFDFNTCHWIGCDFCAHWTHTECAIHVGHIRMGPSKSSRDATEMLFQCKACKHTSALFGWAKDLFCSCAPEWQRDELTRELDSVRHIFRGSQDAKGRRLLWKAEDLLNKLNTGADVNSVCREIQRLFQELEADDTKDYEAEFDKMVEPQVACNRIAEVVHEAIAKMEAVAEEKRHALQKARLALETSDRELEDKRKELAELEIERQRKQEQIEELETIVRLKQAEGDMYQMRSDEACQEAEGLRCIALARSEKVKEDYTSRYLKLRLNEAEAERRYLFEKIQLQEHARSDPLTMCKIQDIMKQAYSKNDLMSTENHGLHKA